MCKKDENQFQCPTNLPRLNVTLPTDQAMRSAWAEKIKGLKFLQKNDENGIEMVAAFSLGAYNAFDDEGCRKEGQGLNVIHDTNCVILDVVTKQGIFPSNYQYDLISHSDINTRSNEDRYGINESIVKYNHLVCQWQALVPELEKCPTGTHKS